MKTANKIFILLVRAIVIFITAWVVVIGTFYVGVTELKDGILTIQEPFALIIIFFIMTVFAIQEIYKIPKELINHDN